MENVANRVIRRLREFTDVLERGERVEALFKTTKIFEGQHNPLCDYMHKLRSIIAALPRNQVTFKSCNWNNLSELKRQLDLESKKC